MMNSMNWKTSLLPAVLSLGLLSACSPPPEPRHLLLVSIDTLRADHLGLYGYARNTSPVMDASLEATTISYDRWYSNSAGNNPMQDNFVVQVSDDGGASWLSLETVGPSGSEVNGGWFHKEFMLANVAALELTSQFRIRFTASDTDPPSIVEAGVDHVRLFAFECEDPCPADLSGNGDVGPEDLAILLGAWGPNPSDPADLNGDDQVGAPDLAILLGNWGACP